LYSYKSICILIYGSEFRKTRIYSLKIYFFGHEKDYEETSVEYSNEIIDDEK